MRILVLCTDAYGGHGGIALFNRDLVEALLTLPELQEVVVVPRVIPHPGSDPVPDRVRFVAVAAEGPLHYLNAVRKLRRESFDLVICAHVNLLPVARLVTDHPLLMVYGIDAWKRLRDPLSVHLLQKCRAVVSISALTRDRLRQWSGFARPMFVLPNAVRAELYGIRPRDEELERRYGLQGKRVLLTVGRLVSMERYKGFDEVIEILPQLPADVVYLIAGGGDDEERLRTLAAHLGVADRVRFTGRFEESEKPALYNLADIYVMPSRGEGFGFVFLEAMASGLPVIGSKHDGGREALLGGELGCLVDPANPAELLATVTELLGRSARAVPPGLEMFSFENFARRVREIVGDT